MRVIGGGLRGRIIRAPRGGRVRPTTDRVKEAIFNRVEHKWWDQGGLMDKDVLDLFAGTGALGIEALSRGARRAVFVEGDPMVARTLKGNIRALGLEDRAVCLLEDVVLKRGAWTRISRLGPFDIVFADPPYQKRLTSMIAREVAHHGLLKPRGLLVVEEGAEKEKSGPGETGGFPHLVELEPRRYGNTLIRMWEHVNEA